MWCIQFQKCFISFILSYKVRKNIALLCCNTNQAGTGHKLHFQPKNPAWAKLAPINNKNGCDRAEVWCTQFRKYFISLILSNKVRVKTALLRCTSNQVGTDHKLHFQPKHPAWAKLAAINNKNGCGRDEVWWRQFVSISLNWYYHIWSGKRQLCSVVPPTKSAQAISSIFNPKIQLGPNWHQPTTKMAVARLRCNAEISEEFHIIDTII